MALRNNKYLLEQSLESAKAMVPTVEAVVEAVVDAAKDGFESAKDVVENASEKAASGAKGAADAVSTKVVEVAPVAEKLPMVEARSHKGRGRFKKLLFLGLFFAVVNVPICVGLILFADRIAGFLKRSPRATRIVDWAFATVLGAFAIRLVLAESR